LVRDSVEELETVIFGFAFSPSWSIIPQSEGNGKGEGPRLNKKPPESGLSRPDPVARRQTQGLSKVFNRAQAKILKAQQRLVGRFADFAYRLQPRCR
jgi:hypothetical protein